MPGLSLKTISDLVPDYRLFANCRACQHSAPLNLARLIATHGPDFRIDQVKPRLRCQGCSSRDCGIQIVWAGNG